MNTDVSDFDATKPIMTNLELDVAGWPDLHGFEGEIWMNTKNTRGKMGEIRGKTQRDN